jgi:modification methylase
MINQIHNENCLDTMARMPDNFVDLVVTSPPYNKSFWSMNQNQNNGDFRTKSRKIVYGDFNDKLHPEEYEKQQRQVLSECIRILKPTGSIFYNHIDILHLHTTIHPKYVYDFPLKQVIIWNRKNTPKLDVSYFYPITEYVFWIKKDKIARPKFYRDMALYKKSVWDISPDASNGHPAPFPISFPLNCILSATDKGDLVYDPYMGSGTTAVAAISENRNYIGSELSSEYVKVAEKRISQIQPKLL